MDFFVACEAVIFGVVVGAVLIGAIARWVYSVLTTVRARHVAGAEHKTRPLMWALPVVLLLHSTPWLLALAGYLSYYVLSHPHAWWWHWFFGALVASPLLLLVPVLRARLVKRAAAKSESVGHAA
jgi:hypothetical protein